MKSNKNKLAINFAILAAVLYGVNTPLSKLLMDYISPTFLASLMYIGSFIGMLIILLLNKNFEFSVFKQETSLTKKEVPIIFIIIFLDILAPILFMIGVNNSTSATSSLLGSFEIVATAFFAFALFKEHVTKKLFVSIILVTIASAVLSVSDLKTFEFSSGAILILIATSCWGLESNLTKLLSIKNPLEIILYKCFGAGFGALGIAYFTNSISFNYLYIFYGLLLGFLSYGVSLIFYIYAQRFIGAAKTTAFYSIAPFVGVLLSFVFFDDSLGVAFYIGLTLIIIALLPIIITKD